MAHPDSAYFVIGRLTLQTTKTFKREFETASWYEMIECAPQTVELRSNGYYLSFAFEGVVTSSYFVNRVFWASSGHADENVGQRRSHTCSPYAYELARVLGNPEYCVVLDEDADVSFEVLTSRSANPAWDHSYVSSVIRAPEARAAIA